MNELAHQLGMDPLNLRIMNEPKLDEGKKIPFSSRHLMECFQIGSEKFAWSKRTPAVGSMKRDGLTLGWGMAGCSWIAARFDAAANVQLRDDGTCRVACATQDIGTGTYTILAQLASAKTGVQLLELSVGKGKRFAAHLHPVLNGIVGGWQAQAIFQGQSGLPLGFGNIIFRGDIQNISLPRDQRSAERWFNTGAGFETAAARQLASNIRTFPLRLSGARAPGVNKWDLAMYKQFDAGERLKIQLRGTMEGAMNHPQFGVPNTVPNNTLFGQITTVQAESRRVLVSLRLMF
jgi:hypothetical protein